MVHSEPFRTYSKYHMNHQTGYDSPPSSCLQAPEHILEISSEMVTQPCAKYSAMSRMMVLFAVPAGVPTQHPRARRAVCSRRAPARARADENSAETESSAAWAAWQRVRSVPEEAAESAEPRDPDAETDFWRGTARELGSTDSTSRSPRDVWGEAREVTVDMNAMQEKLGKDLEQFDPYAETETYREAAREITLQNQADVQWAPPPQDGLQQPAEVEQQTPPVSYPRRPPGGSTYGADAHLDEIANELLSEQGFETRDPAKETDFWRAAAREVVPDGTARAEDVEALVEDVPPETQQPAGSSSAFADFHAADRRWALSITGQQQQQKEGRKSEWAGGNWNEGSDSDKWRAWDSVKAAKNKPSGGTSASEVGALGSDTDMWMAAARQVGSSNGDVNASTEVAETKEEVTNGIAFWAAAAREITVTSPRASDDGEEEVEKSAAPSNE